MKALHMVAFALLLVGGLNWGLVGLFKYNLVEMIFGMDSALTMLVYVLVGASAVYIGLTHMGDCKMCSKK
jgi:uncharacterized membrane protein YuzA (DUF378 family)